LFTNQYTSGQLLRIQLPTATAVRHRRAGSKAEADGLVVFQLPAATARSPAANPNGSLDNIAGIINARGNVIGLMPHPERAMDALAGSRDGFGFFESVLARVAA
jgi:phosphoribosylformylglycinamidine synthase